MGEKKLAEAYILGIPFGLFGAHHFYLGRRNFGILYACTLGLFGLGYLFDLARMKWLVRHANRHGPESKMVSDCYLICFLTGLFGGHHFYLGNKKLGIFYACTLGVFTIGWIADLCRMKYLVEDHNRDTEEKSLGTAYILGLSPFGIFGAHHYYLDNVKLGIIYTCTLGIFGIGWIVDLFRMKKLVNKAGIDKKSIGTAYIMSMPPFGLFGAYHYYLGNYALGITYTLTCGVFTLGWIVDLFRMKDLVKAANDPTSDHGTTKVTAYVLCVSPLGIFGAHHFFLKRYLNGGFYAATFGLFGFGWIFDMFRLPAIYDRFADEDKHKYPDEAYIYWFPFGIFGLHHLYLENKKWAIIYACTFGCLLVGWIIDGFRMLSLIKDFNKYVQDPDMNNLRICKPTCLCSVYKCKRCFMNICGCFEKFSLSRSRPSSQEEDGEMAEVPPASSGKVPDDFDVIQEMYPDDSHENYGQTENEVNCQTEADISTVQESYHVIPNGQHAPPAYDNGAHPGDPGYDEQPLPNNNGSDGHNDNMYPPEYPDQSVEYHDDPNYRHTEYHDDTNAHYDTQNQENENNTYNGYGEQCEQGLNYDESHNYAHDGYDANSAHAHDENTGNHEGVQSHEDVNVSIQQSHHM